MSARLSLILVVALGCRSNEATPSTSTSATPSSPGQRPALPPSAARTPQEREALAAGLEGPERIFRDDPLDEPWATKMHASIKTRAQWADVECRTTQCRVSFIAKTGEEAMARSDELRALTQEGSDKPLAHWMPMPPIHQPDGTLEIRLYAMFTRGPEKESSDDSSKSSL